MRGCSKPGIGWALLLALAAGAPAAHAAVLIEEGPPIRDEGRIESDVQAEADWNRPDSGEGGPSVPARAPAAAPFEDEGTPAGRPALSEPADETPRQSRRRGDRRRTDNSPLVGRADNRMENPYRDVNELRRTRRVGVGASFLGRAGFIGLDAELNLVADHSLLASVGGGPGYTGVSMGYKWTPFTSRWHPSFSAAMAGWVSESENFRDGATLPSFFRPKSGQTDDPRLRAVYLIPAVGLQSLQLRGPGVGGMIFAEALFFVDVSTLAVQPLGSVGAKYFF